MTRFHESESHEEAISIKDIEAYLSNLNLKEGLRIVTLLSSQMLWYPDDPKIGAKANLSSVSLLAKAIVLYASPDGRAFDTSDSESNDLKWLLKAINSLRWYPKSEYEQDQDPTIISSLMRRAYLTHSVAQDAAPVMARAFAMFHERISEATEHKDDLDAALERRTGLSRGEIWTLCAAIYMFYCIDCPKEDRPWVITSSFFSESSRHADLQETLRKAFTAIAKTPEELRQSYHASRKYHDRNTASEYWISEFNILRDFPIVKLGEDEYCCPFPVFAWMRGAIGYYFDLVTHYADIERKRNPKNPNPFDNRMGQILGDVFQDYVGLQLHGLEAASNYVRSEFKYKVGNDSPDSPDWLLMRLPELPLLVECKARRPTIPMQAQCTEADRLSEIQGELARALGQLCIFLRNAQAQRTKPFEFEDGDKCVYALVLYDPFPFHAIKQLRELIDAEAIARDSDWSDFKKHVYFVPLGIHELELACLIEQQTGELIEHQFKKYAVYRNSARTLKGNQFAQHFYEFALDRWNVGDDKMPLASIDYWDRFCDFMFQTIFDESADEYEASQRRRWIEESAYFRWQNSTDSRASALDDWMWAGNEFERLTLELGMAPYQEFRLRPHRAIQERFD